MVKTELPPSLCHSLPRLRPLPVTSRSRHAHTIASHTCPSRRGNPPSPRSLLLPQTTAPPPTAAARFVVKCRMCIYTICSYGNYLLHRSKLVTCWCLPSSFDSHLFHFTQPTHVSPLAMSFPCPPYPLPLPSPLWWVSPSSSGTRARSGPLSSEPPHTPPPRHTR